jgi:inosine/xanthosine triphosphatase
LKTVFIGSANPVKIECTKKGFSEVFGESVPFKFIGRSVDSGISDQPMSNVETLTGARNRAENLKKIFPNGDYYVGIEGGVQIVDGDMEAFAWVVIIHGDQIGKAQTSTFQLPPQIVGLINNGIELGHADDIVFRRNNSKQGNGAVGLLTGDVIDRVEYYRHAVILALVPFINKEYYS